MESFKPLVECNKVSKIYGYDHFHQD